MKERTSGVNKWLAALAAGSLVALGAVLFYFTRGGAAGIRLVNAVQLTSAVGVEDYPTWSPDGDRVAYEARPHRADGNWDIWVAQLGGGDPVNLTADHEGPDRFPSWAPDGRQIAFLSGRDEMWSLYTMSSIGGNPRRLLSLPTATRFSGWSSSPQWSEVGSEIAFPVHDSGKNYLEIVSLETREARRIELPEHEGNLILDLSWESKTNLIAYVIANHGGAKVRQLWIVSPSKNNAIPVTDGLSNDRSPLWSSDGRSLFFVSNRGGSTDLWQQPVSDGRPVGEPKALTTGVSIRSAAFDRNRTRLAYSRGRSVSNLWRTPRPAARSATWADAEQLTFDNAQILFIDVSPDKSRRLVNSDRAGNDDIWTLPRAGGELVLLESSPTIDSTARWSPDGSQIAFLSTRSGYRDLWVASSAGGPARQLTSNPAEDIVPMWSPDGEEIAFTSRRSGNRDIWVIDPDGGEPRQVTHHSADDFYAVWSPDGQWLVFTSWRETRPRLWRVPATGGEPEPVIQGPGRYARWSLDGKALYYVRDENVWTVTL